MVETRKRHRTKPLISAEDEQTASQFWKSRPSTVQSVLGGFEHLSPLDIDTSAAFLSGLGFEPLADGASRSALDNGAGIGRVIKDLFIARNLFSNIDASEPCENFVAELKKIPQINEVFPKKLQDLTPPQERYSLIWNQWVLLYLSDEALVDFLIRSKEGLLPGGFICIKENVIVGARGKPEHDEEDGSVTRTVAAFRKAFRLAGLEIISEQFQPSWPDNLHAVLMLAAKPALPTVDGEHSLGRKRTRSTR